MGKALGSQLGEILDAAVYELPDKAKFVKIKVWFNVNNPIRAGMYIGNDVDGVTWIDFRFENLPMFCFHCGLVGHTEENCYDKHKDEEVTGLEVVNPRGAWLRSNSYGRRIVERAEKTFRSNPRQSLSGGQFSPIPKGLMDMMKDLKVQPETTYNSYREQQPDTGNRQQQTPPGASLSVHKNHLKRKPETAVGTLLSFNECQEDPLMMAGLEDKASQGI
jgi:hypothetical protein